MEKNKGIKGGRWERYLPIAYIVMSIIAVITIGINLYFDTTYGTGINWSKMIVPGLCLVFFIYCIIDEKIEN